MRYLVLFASQLRASLLVTIQYRAELAFALVLALVWTAGALAPLLVLYSNRPHFAGWSWHESLLVVGWFSVLKGLQSSLIAPSMQEAVMRVRLGTLDFVLLKPADSQFLISTTRFELKELSDVVVGLLLLTWAIVRLDQRPTLSASLLAALLLVCGVVILYGIWCMVMSLAFVFVKVDNLTYLFASIFDAARWPAPVFRGVLAFIFTFVLPLTVMTTFPALALRSLISARQVAGAMIAAAVFIGVSRLVWHAAVRRYSSAGG
ncbi:MAG: ABC-2 family transporter protein [Deltaproteobacteria bacterium]|nr:ABC-2 family transporter protein [Deltaproteobacteria bacterium]